MPVELNETARAALRRAHETAAGLGHAWVGTEHILMGLVETGMTGQACRETGLNPAALKEKLRKTQGSRGETTPMGLTQEAVQCVGEACEKAVSLGAGEVDPGHLLLVLLDREEICALTEACGGDPAGLRNALCRMMRHAGLNAPEFSPGTRKTRPTRDKPKLLSQFARELTALALRGELDPVIGREEELEFMEAVLCRRQKCNPVLVGDPGVGKSALVEALALHIAAGQVPAPLEKMRIWALDMACVVAGTRYRGEFEERLRAVLEEAGRGEEHLLFLDELHTIVGAGAAEGSIDAAGILKPLLARGKLRVIGATTWAEYRRHIARDPALERRFQPVLLAEPSPQQTLQILTGLRPRYEKHHQLSIPDETLDAAVSLSCRYVPDRFQPDKALDLLDEAAALRRLHPDPRPLSPGDLTALLRRKNPGLRIFSPGTGITPAHPDDASVSPGAGITPMTPDDAPVSPGTGITSAHHDDAPISPGAGITPAHPDDAPVSPGTGITSVNGETLEERLKQRVLGQEAACEAVAGAVRAALAGLRDPGRPGAAFILAGPTGVGKTELARALADEVFGDKKALIRLDMSEYMEKHSVSRLIGSPPGYVGHEEGGQLTEAVRRRPFSVVVFDEIEKAHPEIFHLLLQVLEEGCLTDALGQSTDFRHTFLLLTTNAGSSAPRAAGFSPSRGKTSVCYTQALQLLFPPELLGRLDGIVTFSPLGVETLTQLARRELIRCQARLALRGLDLQWDDDDAVFLAHLCPSHEGARALRRLLRIHVELPAAAALDAGSVSCRVRRE